MAGEWHLGIDPGAQGGLGVIGPAGEFIAAHRWSKPDPASLYNILLLIRDRVDIAYLEQVNAHPGEGVGQVTQNYGLFVNHGIWQGFLLAAGLRFVLVHPNTWQAALGLRNWQKAQKLNPAAPSPLSLARSRWPQAPLEFQADDGKAVGLLLAALALRDRQEGFDRLAAGQVAAAKKLRLRRQRLAATKLPDGGF